jgi:hypothetical protein
MKVKEYVEILKQFPQDLEIAQEYDSMLFTPNKPEIKKIVKSEEYDNFFFEATDADEKDKIIETVVI